MTDLPPFADTVAALEALRDACSDFDPMHRLSLIGLYSRADGMGRADLDSAHWNKDGARVAKPYAAAALLSEPSSLVTAALRMAVEIPDLQVVPERTARSMARGYLPAVSALGQSHG